MLTHFFFRPQFEYFSNSDALFKGLLFIAGISLILTPLFKKFENALTATLLTICMCLLAEGRYGHWSTILFQLRQYLGENAIALVTRSRCLLFPDTFYCWQDYLRPDSYPPYIAFVLIALINAAIVWLLCAMRNLCFPGLPSLPSFFRKDPRETQIFSNNKQPPSPNAHEPKQDP